MRRNCLFVMFTVAVLGACSNDDVVRGDTDTSLTQAPIEFNVQKQNIVRAANLETVKHYNFGVWAWKVQGKNSMADSEVMDHYLVGWSNGVDKGYDNSGVTTYAADAGTTADHTSPWFYEKLGSSEYGYTGDAGFYKKTDADYMSGNANQYLRYWDMAFAKTNFYCYAPYNKNVTFTKATDNSVMIFGPTVIRDGYDEPLNSAYSAYSRTLGEYMYAGVQATSADQADVTVPFQHMGAQLFIRFYEDIPGYKVEIIELAQDRGTAVENLTEAQKGIQATPAIKPTSGTTYENGTYYTTQGATVTFAEADAKATYAPSWTGSTTATNTAPLMFKIPTRDLSTAADAPANLTYYPDETSKTWSIIKEKTTDGNQEYSYSPTIYYPVAQPTTSTTGLTFHISYRIIAEDNHEVITIHNATVFVPVKGTTEEGTTDSPITQGGTEYYITAWQPNVKYTYTFKFTKGGTGTTDPDATIDPTDPTPGTVPSLFPIVFERATLDDYTDNYSEHVIQGNPVNN